MMPPVDDIVNQFQVWVALHKPDLRWEAWRVDAADLFWNNADIILAVACRDAETAITDSPNSPRSPP